MSILCHLPRFRQLDAILRQYEQREHWTRAEIECFQLEALNRNWAHARGHVPYYRELPGDFPDRFGSITEYTQTVPILKKSLVRENPHQFLADDAARGKWYRTGGSTGDPLAIYWEHQAHLATLRAKYRCEQSYGLEVFDRKVFLWGHGGSFDPGYKGYLQRGLRPLQDALRNRRRVSAYDLTRSRLTEKLERIARYRPCSLYGYSSALNLLADAASQGAVRLPTLKLIIMTAEPADQAMRHNVATHLGATAVIEYGAVECGLMAYLMPDNTLRTRDDVVLLETLPNRLGRHDIVLSVLHNRSFPLLRYRIEDVTSEPVRHPQRGFGIVADIQGRSNDILLGKSGCRLHPMALKHSLESYPAVRRFTANQRTDGSLEVRLETSSPISNHLLATIQSRLQTMLQGYPVHAEVVEKISGNLAGKHRWIQSELAQKTAAETESIGMP